MHWCALGWMGGRWPAECFSLTSEPSLDHERRAGPSQSSQTRNFPHLRPTTENLTGVSKEQSALFNHSRHDVGGGGCGMRPEAPFPWPEPGEGRVCWQIDGGAEEAARLPCLCSTCSSKCKVASGQFWARSETSTAGADMVLPVMPAESLKLRPI